MFLRETLIKNRSSYDKGHLDLWKANKKQLMQAGIPEENIEVGGICTHCHADTYFSRRHQKGDTGRFGSGIMVKSG